VSQLSRQCGILNISQAYRPPRPIAGIALLFLLFYANYLQYMGQAVFIYTWVICLILIYLVLTYFISLYLQTEKLRYPGQTFVAGNSAENWILILAPVCVITSAFATCLKQYGAGSYPYSNLSSSFHDMKHASHSVFIFFLPDCRPTYILQT
jgi:hypothetical protein